MIRNNVINAFIYTELFIFLMPLFISIGEGDLFTLKSQLFHQQTHIYKDVS